MKAAFSYWANRIAPVFDTSREIQLVESHAGLVIDSRAFVLSAELPMQRTLQLADLGVETLVCGAISKPMQSMITAYGIRIVPFVAGELSQVMQGWLEGRLENETFVMPGCRGRGSVAGEGRKGQLMNGQGRGRGGRGQGQGSQGMGRGNCASFSAAGDRCLCPACGHPEPHRRGAPCMQQRCPQCGAAMTRG